MRAGKAIGSKQLKHSHFEPKIGICIDELQEVFFRDWIVAELLPISHIEKVAQVGAAREKYTGIDPCPVSVASQPIFPYRRDMEVYLTPEQEARFLAAVEKGLGAARRGEFIEEEEMAARLEAMFKA